jgi:hypothetical protein
MNYSEIKENDSPIPDPALNGGLYNGNPFRTNAPWANIYVRPTTSFMTQNTLRTANPPNDSLYQMPTMMRPGNNTDDAFVGINYTAFRKIGYPCYCSKPDTKSNALKNLVAISPFNC